MNVVSQARVTLQASPLTRLRLGALTGFQLLDVVAVLSLAVAAAVLRFVDLGHLPYGLHGDEASTGLDAQRILSEGSIGPYTPSALGQPAGPMYAAAVSVELLGNTIESVRAPMAVFGVLTVLLSFFLLRSMFGRVAAYTGAFLLTFSAWLIFYNRTGYTVSAFPFTEAAAILCVWLAVTRQSWTLALLAGVVVGLGVYGYFAYPLFALGLGLWALLHLLLQRPQPFAMAAGRLALIGIAALIMVMPMRPYLMNGEDGPGYLHDRKAFSIFETDKYKDAEGLAGRLDVIADNAWVTIERLLWEQRTDASDGSGEWPALDFLTIALAAAGLAVSGYQIVRRRDSRYLLAPLLIVFVSFGPVLSVDSTNRRSLGLLLPVVMIASVGASALVRAYLSTTVRYGWREAGFAAVAAVIAFTAYYAGLNVNRYFGDFAGAPAGRATFAAEVTEAATLMSRQPEGSVIYFASERWSVNYETVRFLAGDVEGHDRLSSFAKEPGWQIDRRRPSLVLLLNRFKRTAADELGRQYPDARRIEGPEVNGNPAYVAFFLPPLPD